MNVNLLNNYPVRPTLARVSTHHFRPRAPGEIIASRLIKQIVMMGDQHVIKLCGLTSVTSSQIKDKMILLKLNLAFQIPLFSFPLMFDVDGWSRTTTTQHQGNTKYDWEGKQSGESFHVVGSVQCWALARSGYKWELLIRSAIKNEGWTEYNFHQARVHTSYKQLHNCYSM